MTRWNTVAVYGVGLIGGSVGMAVKERKLAKRVIGIGRNPDRLASAVRLSAIDEFVTDVAESPAPDLAVLCAPVQRLPDHCAAIAEHFPDALITDAGSTKQRLIEQIEAECPQANFVGSHPMAGSERSGVEHSGADLFEGCTVIITPTQTSKPESAESVTEFWKALGAKIVTMSPKDHDRALAIASHVPHVISSALAAETPENVLPLVAGGWRDTTRIAAADVEMWTQIMLENNAHVSAWLNGVQSRLNDFETALENNDRETISRLLTAGKQRRDALGS